MKGAWGLTAVLLACAAFPAAAGTLYRCIGNDGITQYVSKRVSGARCTVAASYRPERPRPAASTPAPASSAAGAAAGTSPAPATPAPAASKGSRRVSGQVYSYIKDGVRHYSSTPPRGAAAAGATAMRTIRYSFIEQCYACGSPGVSFANVRLNTDAFREEVAAAAREFGVEEAIVRAVMHAESAFNPNAISRAGAQGLMQLMPATAERFGVTDAFDPAQNIRGGVRYLAWLLKRFNGDLTLAAAGYNAGEGAVDRHGGVPPYRETQTYVQRVGVLAERYRSHGLVAASGAP
ncbi:lytic transglycosylase domain-containing protein [Luteimonas sp. JM171]|uniref:lytic transglycosylase domain-containing protein n=1 Tax=Luteimonas sp. JM171 TaxID=1896164 RepID=UPI000855C9BE|nr:lytic transglycosylase domain-containing protein [Luteimonas sp. JM171]AOH35000.1 transglycosylase [Luteimonas sp. JM171]